MGYYPDGMKLRPIDTWPGQLPREFVHSPFKAPIGTTVSELDLELRHLGTGGVNAPSVLQLALREADFRIDGMPRANARPEHPGVILTIDSKHGQLSYPAAKFKTWQDNLRAITLGLNGLRRLDRYGITPGSEQYTGWKQLPAGGSEEITFDGLREAENLLRRIADMPDAPLPKVFRAAQVKTHPDRTGDSAESRARWDSVEAAGTILRRAGQLS
ncbi:molecular chaperone DnaJ [Mycolicibacterium conceptionense]|uniref:molecular chaperone DnaJ n=1 Tax=Mycolicibacterium conceptionense TaxID=451644 RepID=UPI000B1B475D|nr:molecular chaperone DnaJ [Mycolicibacterium conceptionense]